MCLHGVALERREGFTAPELDSSLSFNTNKYNLTLVTETLFIAAVQQFEKSLKAGVMARQKAPCTLETTPI